MRKIYYHVLDFSASGLYIRLMVKRQQLAPKIKDWQEYRRDMALFTRQKLTFLVAQDASCSAECTALAKKVPF